jgi:hypothetical protein
VFPSSDDGRETPTLLGPLEKANLNNEEPTHIAGALQTPDTRMSPRDVTGTYAVYPICEGCF